MPVEGVPLIPVTVTIDERSNSIIAAGSRNDLLVIQAISDKLLDAADVQRAAATRSTTCATSPAVDVANAPTTFITA